MAQSDNLSQNINNTNNANNTDNSKDAYAKLFLELIDSQNWPALTDLTLYLAQPNRADIAKYIVSQLSTKQKAYLVAQIDYMSVESQQNYFQDFVTNLIVKPLIDRQVIGSGAELLDVSLMALVAARPNGPASRYIMQQLIESKKYDLIAALMMRLTHMEDERLERTQRCMVKQLVYSHEGIIGSILNFIFRNSALINVSLLLVKTRDSAAIAALVAQLSHIADERSDFAQRYIVEQLIQYENYEALALSTMQAPFISCYIAELLGDRKHYSALVALFSLLIELPPDNVVTYALCNLSYALFAYNPNVLTTISDLLTHKYQKEPVELLEHVLANSNMSDDRSYKILARTILKSLLTRHMNAFSEAFLWFVEHERRDILTALITCLSLIDAGDANNDFNTLTSSFYRFLMKQDGDGRNLLMNLLMRKQHFLATKIVQYLEHAPFEIFNKVINEQRNKDGNSVASLLEQENGENIQCIKNIISQRNSSLAAVSVSTANRDSESKGCCIA